MNQTFEFSRTVNGKSEREIVTLHSQENCDFHQILYRIALEFCSTPKGRALCSGGSGLSFAQLMDNAGPELFKKYGITVVFPAKNAIQIDESVHILAPYELEMYHDVCEYHQQQLNQLRDFASRLARRLFTLWKHGDSVVSTWDPAWIPAKSIEWAYKFLKQGKRSPQELVEFFEQNVREAKTGKYDRSSEQCHAIEDALVICTSEQ